MESRLIIFVKNPVKGKVKTRLAATVGDEKALSVYLKLLELTKEVASNVNAKRLLFYSDFIEQNDQWPSEQYEKRVQLQHNNLGERMKDAFKKAFEEGADKAVIIGSDCPEITPEIIELAFEKLGTHDLVIGPSSDGGYYLLGMNNYCEALFFGIKWSSTSVLQGTVEIIETNEWDYFLLPELNDLDDEGDLNYFDNKMWKPDV